MSKPWVAAVMITADRAKYAQQAILQFRRQTYPNKRLVILDTGIESCFPRSVGTDAGIEVIWRERPEGAKIGDLRNIANAATRGADIVAHWDDDDWSHPHRLDDQVRLLTTSKDLECVGFNELPFWHEPFQQTWVYRNKVETYAMGTSLCYWREVWSRCPFPSMPQQLGATGEDTEWIRKVKCFGHTGMFRWLGPSGSGSDYLQPRMVARIHTTNHGDYAPETLQGSYSWQREESWDAFCKFTFQGGQL